MSRIPEFKCINLSFSLSLSSGFILNVRNGNQMISLPESEGMLEMREMDSLGLPLSEGCFKSNRIIGDLSSS